MRRSTLYFFLFRRSKSKLARQYHHGTKTNFPSEGPKPKLILSPQSQWDKLCTGFIGAVSCLFNSKARDEFISLTEKNLIREDVLRSTSSVGSMIMFNLYQNLRNPIWKECSIDMEAFMKAASPALENFYDILGKVRNLHELPLEGEDPSKRLLAMVDLSLKDIAEDPKDIEDRIRPFLGDNLWREKAASGNEKDSLFLALSKMVSPTCFDNLFYKDRWRLLRIDILNLKLKNRYVPGSCKVLNAALLNARAQYMKKDEDGKLVPVHENDGDINFQDAPVAGQVEVLFEIEITVEEHEDVDDNAGSLALEREGDNKKSRVDPRIETYLYTVLIVPVFEGWIKGGPDKDFRWRLSTLRHPEDLAYLGPTVIKTRLGDTDGVK